MGAVAVGLLTLATTLAGAFLGWWLGQRLPPKHLNSDSRDVIKVAMAMVATVSGLVLGLLVASAKSSFDAKDAAVRQVAVQAIVLDRTLAEYGPETKEIRTVLRELLAARCSRFGPPRDRRRSILRVSEEAQESKSFNAGYLRLLLRMMRSDGFNRLHCSSLAMQPRGVGWRSSARAAVSNGRCSSWSFSGWRLSSQASACSR
jgi:hypothetical protein